jgi:hypothetical protein
MPSRNIEKPFTEGGELSFPSLPSIKKKACLIYYLSGAYSLIYSLGETYSYIMNDIILVILALAFLLQDRSKKSLACPSFAAGKVIPRR